MVLKASGPLPNIGSTSIPVSGYQQNLFSSLPKRSRVAIQPSKREPCNTIKEVIESTDFNFQRANLVQLWLCITLIIITCLLFHFKDNLVFVI